MLSENEGNEYSNAGYSAIDSFVSSFVSGDAKMNSTNEVLGTAAGGLASSAARSLIRGEDMNWAGMHQGFNGYDRLMNQITPVVGNFFGGMVDKYQAKEQAEGRGEPVSEADSKLNWFENLVGMAHEGLRAIRNVGQRIGNAISGEGWNTNAQVAQKNLVARLSGMTNEYKAELLTSLSSGDKQKIESAMGVIQEMAGETLDKYEMNEFMNSAAGAMFLQVEDYGNAVRDSLKGNFRKDSVAETEAKKKELELLGMWTAEDEQWLGGERQKIAEAKAERERLAAAGQYDVYENGNYNNQMGMGSYFAGSGYSVVDAPGQNWVSSRTNHTIETPQDLASYRNGASQVGGLYGDPLQKQLLAQSDSYSNQIMDNYSRLQIANSSYDLKMTETNLLAPGWNIEQSTLYKRFSFFNMLAGHGATIGSIDSFLDTGVLILQNDKVFSNYVHLPEYNFENSINLFEQADNSEIIFKMNPNAAKNLTNFSNAAGFVLTGVAVGYDFHELKQEHITQTRFNYNTAVNTTVLALSAYGGPVGIGTAIALSTANYFCGDQIEQKFENIKYHSDEVKNNPIRQAEEVYKENKEYLDNYRKNNGYYEYLRELEFLRSKKINGYTGTRG